MEESKIIGNVRIIMRYPVKSMMGEDLETANVTDNGIYGDRVYAFIDEENKTNFPWITARQKHEMILFKTKIVENQESRDDVKIMTPDGEEFDINDLSFKEYLEKRFGKTLRLKYSKKSYFDSKKISIFGLQTIEELGKELGFQLDYKRFRANFYIDWYNKKPFFEAELVGKTIRIGETELNIIKRIGRCIIITLEPATAESNFDVLKHV